MDTKDDNDPVVDVDMLDDFLTDEDREALKESDFLEDDPTDDDAGEGDDGANAEGAGEGGDAVDPDPEPAAAEPDPDPEPDPNPQPEPKAEARAKMPDVDISQLDEQLAGFKDQRNDLLSQYEDGDMTVDEYRTKLDELDEQADAVKAQKAVAQDQVQRVADDWKGAVEAHLGAYPDLRTNEAVLRGFDRAVRAVTGNPDYAHMSFDRQLTAAHELLAFQAKHTGMKGVPELKGANPEPKPDPAPDPKTDPKPDAKATDKDGDEDGNKPDMRTPPVTLANTPASDISGGSDSPYATLERMAQGDDPIAFEAALARLTPEQRDEFSSLDIGD